MSRNLFSPHKPSMLTRHPGARMVVAAAAAVVMMTGTVAMAADAAALWDKNCASCHGADGKGKTKMGEKLKVRDLTDAAVKAKLTKASVEASMTKGVKADDSDKLVMKSYSEKLSADEIKALVDHTLALK